MHEQVGDIELAVDTIPVYDLVRGAHHVAVRPSRVYKQPKGQVRRPRDSPRRHVDPRTQGPRAQLWSQSGKFKHNRVAEEAPPLPAQLLAAMAGIAPFN